MESLNSVHFIELDPFLYKNNICEKFKKLIKDGDIQFLEEVGKLLEQRMKQLTENNYIIPEYNEIKLSNPRKTIQNT